MAEPSYWLSTIADVAAVLGLYQPKERSAPFFTKALSLPTIATRFKTVPSDAWIQLVSADGYA